MSDNPNTKDDRRSARSRLRAEQLRRRRTRSRRIKAAIVAAALLGGGVAIAIGTAGSGSAHGPLSVPANASGAGGTVIVYGGANARHTLDVWEDFRCPYCRKLETADGPVIQHLADTGRYKIQYHLGTFLDDNLGGHGSVNALQAAGAALDESPAKFKAFHDVLYADQPDERTDAFGDNDHLLALAAKVPGLSTPRFVKAVNDGTYAAWARKAGDAFAHSDVHSTPTLKLDGRQLPIIDGGGAPVTPAQYTAMIDQVVGGDQEPAS